MAATSEEVAGQAGAAVIGAGYGPADFKVPPGTATLIAEAVPANTALAYRSRWRSFDAWCARAGRVALPATAQTVAAYLTHLATERGLKATTVDAHLTAIRAVHRGAGATAPDALTARKVVVAAQRREAARDGRYGPRKAVPVMAADLPAIVAACDDQTAAGLRDRAVVLLGFALLARRSELAALNLSDFELVPGEGIAVTIRASKTDQSARGLVRRIHYASNEPVCPVRALLTWTAFLAARGITTGPLFTRIDRWGNVGPAAGGRYADPLGSDRAAGQSFSAATSRDGRLRPQAVGAIVTALCESAGLAGRAGATSSRADPVGGETRRYSGHSLRRGGATSMLAAGAQPLHVSRHGRWSDGSGSFAGYVEEATGFGDANPTKGLLLYMPGLAALSEEAFIHSSNSFTGHSAIPGFDLSAGSRGRLAMGRLTDAYAHCIDRKQPVRDLKTEPMPGPEGGATTRQDRWARVRHSLWQSPRPHGEQPHERVVGPLELFYDLAVVVLIAQAARRLAGHLAWSGLGQFAVVFTLVWIAWANGSLHYELHGREDARSRITFLVQILVLAVIGACIPAASGARGGAFAVATAVLFAILAGLWLRAGHGDRPEYRRSSRLYVAGTAAFAVLMACTALLPASARIPAWGLLDAAYLVVFGAVILTASAGASLIVTDALIERFGTLTIIVLGEILTSVVAGLATQPLSGLTVSVGLVAVVVGFGAWWTYFDFTGQRQPKPTRPATAQWMLGHLPLTASIAAMGAAVVSLIDHAHDSRTPVATAWVLCAGAAVVLCATILVSASLQARHGDPALHQLLIRSCIPVAAACLGVGAIRPAPLLLCVALVVLLGVPWVLAVAHQLANTSESPSK